MTTFHARCVMNGKPTTYFLLPLVIACGGTAPSGRDPQAPAPYDPKAAASTIVICPEGSSYDPGRNACVAGSTSAPPPTTNDTSGGPSSIRVSCGFRNGWVAVVPETAYPDDDEFIMQALIGFSEEPDFWNDQSEYQSLARYKARRCTQRSERFELEPGAYFVIVGETGTFGRRGAYNNNGYRRRVRLARGESLDIDLDGDDLNHTWYCISCPWVSFFDPSLGRYLPGFVVLAHRYETRRRGTDRVVVENVPVSDGKIRLRVNEVEPEVSYLDQLVLEVDGVRVLPSRGGERSALAHADGINVMMSQGTEFVAVYEVPHVTSSHTTVTVIAHGHYEPVP